MLTKRTRKGAVLAAAAAMTPGAGWVLPVPADAQEAEPVSDQRAAAPQEADQAGLYARDFDVDVAEARDRLSHQGQLASTLVELQQLAGERFAGAWIEHQPDFRGVVRLTGPVEDTAALEAVAADSPVPVEVRTDASLSLAQLETERARVQDALRQTLPGATTGLHEPSGSVMVYAPAADRAERKTSEESMPEAQAVTDAPVRVTYQQGRGRLHHDYGGDRIDGCTSGFSVFHLPTNQAGIVSAGHCGDGQTYLGYAGESYPLTLQQWESSQVTDVAIYTSDHESYPELYADSTTARSTLTSVTAWSNQLVGSWVCHQGITTGYSCGTIADRATTECYTGPGGEDIPICDPNWVRVQGPNLACWDGDSGGPWFNGASAYGINHGGWTWLPLPGWCEYAIYTPIDFKFSQTGAVVLGG